MLGNSGARAVVCETAEQRAKIDRVREELPDLSTTIGIEGDAGEMTLEAVRDRGRGGDHAELDRRQSAVSRD